jgi:hypothetical protein
MMLFAKVLASALVLVVIRVRVHDGEPASAPRQVEIIDPVTCCSITAGQTVNGVAEIQLHTDCDSVFVKVTAGSPALPICRRVKVPRVNSTLEWTHPSPQGRLPANATLASDGDSSTPDEKDGAGTAAAKVRLDHPLFASRCPLDTLPQPDLPLSHATPVPSVRLAAQRGRFHYRDLAIPKRIRIPFADDPPAPSMSFASDGR